MTDPKHERWRRADRIFNDSLAFDPERRATFLREACGDDAAPRSDVEAWLEAEQAAAVVREEPALHVLAEALAEGATSLIGSQLGDYRVESLLGAGGMGEVYSARDLRLDRDVALKVLDAATSSPDDLRRFGQEARSASGLNHPNIVTIYGVGERDGVAYIAMERVHGQTLRGMLASGRVKPDAAMDIAVQLADALAAAHGAGVVHRDLKPDNVMVTPDGLVKVLDFGIARRIVSPSIEGQRPEGHRQPSQTGSGLIRGTVGYMSPEQAAGREVDFRSDQFSLGAILYELLSGRRAFERSTGSATIAAILSEQPAPIINDITWAPRELERVVNRCLAKDANQRYARTRDLARDLHDIRDGWKQNAWRLMSRRQALWLAAGSAVAGVAGLSLWRYRWGSPPIRRLAVLPFINTAADENAEYLCDGIADSLIQRLALVPGVEVKALSAVLHFKGPTINSQAIGRQLNADVVLTGSLFRRAGRLSITAELVDVAHATRLWGGTFDRPQADVLAVQDEIAASIIRDGFGLAASSADARPFARAWTRNPLAYDLYLQAVHYCRLEREDAYLTSRELLVQAIAHDDAFALAHVTLASTYTVMAVDGYESPSNAWPSWSSSISRALALDPDLPDAHAEASAAAFFYQWDWAAADREWRIATGSRRGEVQPELLGARALQLWALSRTNEALQFARAARLADPLSAVCALAEADVVAKTDRLEQAAALYEKIIRDWPDDSRAYFGLADARRLQGRFDEAIAVRRQAAEVAGDDSLNGLTLQGAAGYAQLERESARMQLEDLKARAATQAYVSPLELARVHARLGERDRAFEFLATAFEHRAAGLVFLRVDPAWESVRNDSRLQDAVRRVGLPAV